MVAVTFVLGPSQPAAEMQDTQYGVVTLIEGVVKGLPLPIAVPPVAALYQVRVPVHPVPSKTTVPGPQLVPSTLPGATGTELIVAVTAVLGPSQPLIVQET